jgi:hypothetical protein
MSKQWIEPSDAPERRGTYVEQLQEIFDSDPATVGQRLEVFPKFVPTTAVARFLARYELYKLIQDVPGAIVEAGVLGGAGLFSFVHCALLLEPHNPYRRILGFDTFEGFTSISDVDRRGTSAFMHEGGYKDDCYDQLKQLAAVHESFRFLNRRPQVELVRGDICETVPRYVEEHAELVVALLYLDCDLYAPTKVCLERLVPLMPKGAVVVCDELTLAEYPGETAAVRETLGISRLRFRKFPFLKCAYAILE